MACLTESVIQAGPRGFGWQLYFDPDLCTQVSNSSDPTTVTGENDYTRVACSMEGKIPGGDWDTISDEGCSDQTVQSEEVSTRKRTPFTGKIRLIRGSAEDLALRTLNRSGEIRSWVIRVPIGNGAYVYDWFDGQLKKYDPGTMSKTQFIEADIEVLPRSDTYTVADPATLGAGLMLADGSVTV